MVKGYWIELINGGKKQKKKKRQSLRFRALRPAIHLFVFVGCFLRKKGDHSSLF